jgi:PAS domain S-box-containing protein
MNNGPRSTELGPAVDRGLREITDHLPGAVYRLRLVPGGGVKLLYVSEGIGRLVGIEKLAAEADIRTLFSLVAAEDFPALQDAIGAVFSQLREIVFDFRFRHAVTGQTRWLRSQAAPFRDRDGSVLCDGLWQDITDIKQLEAELELARDEARTAVERLRDITDKLPGMVYQTRINPDLSTKFMMVSEGIRDMYGLTPEELMKDSLLIQRMIVKEDMPKIWKLQLEALRKNEPVTYDFRVRRWDGTVRWHRSTANAHMMDSGAVTWTGFTFDITAQKELEEKLKAVQSALDQQGKS